MQKWYLLCFAEEGEKSDFSPVFYLCSVTKSLFYFYFFKKLVLLKKEICFIFWLSTYHYRYFCGQLFIFLLAWQSLYENVHCILSNWLMRPRSKRMRYPNFIDIKSIGLGKHLTHLKQCVINAWYQHLLPLRIFHFALNQYYLHFQSNSLFLWKAAEKKTRMLDKERVEQGNLKVEGEWKGRKWGWEEQ